MNPYPFPLSLFLSLSLGGYQKDISARQRQTRQTKP
jgi:hypothetical protein